MVAYGKVEEPSPVVSFPAAVVKTSREEEYALLTYQFRAFAELKDNSRNKIKVVHFSGLADSEEELSLNRLYIVIVFIIIVFQFISPLIP
jgi:hypothetical protein